MRILGQGVYICDALRQEAEELPDWIFVYPAGFILMLTNRFMNVSRVFRMFIYWIRWIMNHSSFL